MKITESMNLVDLFCGISKISLAKYVGLVYKDEEIHPGSGFFLQ